MVGYGFRAGWGLASLMVGLIKGPKSVIPNLAKLII
jgi:hypothetical protein